MNLKCSLNLHILLCLVLVFVEKIFGQGCDSNGLKCISCSEYQKCNAGFLDEKIISCNNGGSCNDFELKQCQMRLKCYELNECTEVGIFPDALVDSDFYVCMSNPSSGLLKFSFSCPENNFFNKLTVTCEPRSNTLSTLPSTPTTLPSTPSTLSSTPSTLSSTPSTPSSTPSTLSSTPSTLSSTPSTLPSTLSTLSSTPSTLSSTPSTLSSTPSTLPSTPSTMPSTSLRPTSPPISPSTLTPAPPTEIPFACSGPGIFPNPGNCKMYYRCSTSLKAFFYICPGNSFFNEILLKCSLVITTACQEQILKNSTSTPSPTPPVIVTPSDPTTVSMVTTTSTATPTTTTSSTPTSTITAPTTTTSSTPTSTITAPTTTTTATSTTPSNSPFLCTNTGTYADPVNCKVYYRCSISGKIFRYNCPGGTYFNEFTNRCSAVITPRCRNLIQG